MVGNGTREDQHYEMHHYDILGIDVNASVDDIKKKFRNLSLFAHPDRVKNRNGGVITKEDYARWNDIYTSYEVLTDEFLKDLYDRNNIRGRTTFQCTGCNVAIKEDEERYKSTKSFHFFCNQFCSQIWEADNDYTDNTHKYPQKKWTPPAPEGERRVCLQCSMERGFSRDLWKKHRETDPDDYYCCSDSCLEDLLTQIRRSFVKCARCHQVRTFKTRGPWEKHDGEVYCSEKCYELKTKGTGAGGVGTGDGSDILQAEKDAAVDEITKALNQSPLVANDELETNNQSWRNDIQNAGSAANITTIKDRVLADIQAKRNAKGGDPLKAQKNSAINTIKAKMAENPAVETTELESGNQTWENDINTATDEDQINAIKTKVLTDISAKRQGKSGTGVGSGGGGDSTQKLDQLKQYAISAIETALNQDPPINSSELTNSNWKNDLNNASEETAITQLKDQLLAEIKIKRQEQSDEQQILALIARGEQQNDYSELAATIQELEKYRSRSAAYQKHGAKIDQLEAKLNKLDPEKYKEEIKSDLDQQIKNAGLSTEEIETETQQAIKEAISNPTPEKKKAAKEAISQNEANVGLKKLLKQARTLKTKDEKQAMITQILTYFMKSSYCKKAKEKFAAEVQEVLTFLEGKKENATSTFDNSFPWLKIVLPLTLVSLFALILGWFWWKKRAKVKK